MKGQLHGAFIGARASEIRVDRTVDSCSEYSLGLILETPPWEPFAYPLRPLLDFELATIKGEISFLPQKEGKHGK